MRTLHTGAPAWHLISASQKYKADQRNTCSSILSVSRRSCSNWSDIRQNKIIHKSCSLINAQIISLRCTSPLSCALITFIGDLFSSIYTASGFLFHFFFPSSWNVIRSHFQRLLTSLWVEITASAVLFVGDISGATALSTARVVTSRRARNANAMTGEMSGPS